MELITKVKYYFLNDGKYLDVLHSKFLKAGENNKFLHSVLACVSKSGICDCPRKFFY